MSSFILRRILTMIPVVIIISILAFIVISLPPGDYVTSYIARMEAQFGSGSREVRQMADKLRGRYGIDRPIYVQYYMWMKGIILRGDFGRSFSKNRPVIDIIKSRVPWSVVLGLFSLVFTWVIGVPIGVYSAVKQYTKFDYFFTFFSFIGKATPNFLLALILMYLFYTWFGWSMGGLFSSEMQSAPWSFMKVLDLLKHLILPVIVLGTAGTAGKTRVTRGLILDELEKQYIQTARSKGLAESRVVWFHALKVALVPQLATIGWSLAGMFSGAMIVSIVVNLPTTGPVMLSALQSQDMYLAGSFILILSVLTVVGTLISDIVLAIVDPRITYE